MVRLSLRSKKMEKPSPSNLVQEYESALSTIEFADHQKRLEESVNQFLETLVSKFYFFSVVRGGKELLDLHSKIYSL